MIINRTVKKRMNEASNGEFYMGKGALLIGGENKFTRNEVRDASAETIYERLIDVFGFNKDKLGYFKRHHSLNAANCSPEGYGVIFANPYDEWKIEGHVDKGYLTMIKETPINSSLIRSEAPVLIFIRYEEGGYVAYLFAGVYEPGKVSEDGCEVTYELKTKVYGG